MTTSTDWLDRALAAPAHDAEVSAGGVRVAYRVWESAHATSTVVLVHGGAAHSRWWDAVAPLLANERRVIALDLSGHGDSGWRDSYDMQSWVSEVLSLLEQVVDGEVVLVGHSLGGLVVTDIRRVLDAEKSPPPVVGVIAIDAVFTGESAQAAREDTGGYRMRRVYPTLEAGLARFRPVPDQAAIPELLDHIGRHSLRSADDGWTWKFDYRAFLRPLTRPAPAEGRIPYAYIRAEHGLAGADIREIVEGAGGDFFEIADAGHAPMLDKPLVLAEMLRGILDGWRHARET